MKKRERERDEEDVDQKKDVLRQRVLSSEREEREEEGARAPSTALCHNFTLFTFPPAPPEFFAAAQCVYEFLITISDVTYRYFLKHDLDPTR
jgi:hypothetical protein